MTDELQNYIDDPSSFHTLLSAASTGDRSTLPAVPIMYGAIARKVNKYGMAETR